MTPAQRRWKWVKKERLPLHMQEMLNQGKKPAKDTGKDKEKEKEKDKTVGQANVDKLKNALAPSTEKEAKETILNLKTDYSVIDFTKADNVVKKIKEL